MKLWLVRHARVLVPSGICYGASDLIADEAATKEAANAFASLPGVGCNVWVSPANRAKQLASEICRVRSDLEGPLLVEGLREMDFGSWEMVNWCEIPKAAVDSWTDDFAHHKFGGAESVLEVLTRVRQVLDQAKALHHEELVLITHAGVIRAVQWLCYERSYLYRVSARHWPKSAPEMGGWMEIEF